MWYMMDFMIRTHAWTIPSEVRFSMLFSFLHVFCTITGILRSRLSSTRFGGGNCCVGLHYKRRVRMCIADAHRLHRQKTIKIGSVKGNLSWQ